MRLTLRGWTALFVVVVSLAMGWEFGPRALNAVVVPLAVVLLAGVVAVGRADRPEIRRAPVPEGFPGDRRTIELAIESSATVSATVRDDVGDGIAVLESDDETAAIEDGAPVVETTLAGDDRVGYEIRLEERGEHRLGPATITVSDLFGLVRRRFADEGTTTALVYPRVYEVRSGPGSEVRAVTDALAGQDRDAFDHLREYQRGDSLRDVHWKSAAKRPDADLVVTEYADTEETGTATIAAECVSGRDDELATAVASVARHLLEADVDVGLALPNADCEPGSGHDHARRLLAAAARLEAGELEAGRREEADVVIRSDADGTRVVIDDRSIPFERLVGDRDRERTSHDRLGAPDLRGRDRPDGGPDESGVPT
ncbi:protein of unknown function DUF58 [Haloterrigena turkmenica DSM 5511]|uniref:Uncharacterized protein n=1 Tax=Haloterrigena turkmenica (strain ATCC 51198 / DSM 5511 / JCM 9101 / NCIMB 13204 / VKM B-1734 / 4k) TaxID=543526 RepID=D2RR44_HALTV|nr:DUF58 domain-containing protein [Haloterrigena turkmenica]ADB62440.1 protein of unknown function DUF58 [Haloterrigena turkmenica DSM 5511]